MDAGCIASNARRLAKDAFHLSVALELVAPVPGRTWTAVCCSCLERIDHAISGDLVYRLAMESWQSFPGGCMLCPYSCCDTLVAALLAPVAVTGDVSGAA
jgi:hypothetical protein